MRVLSTQVGGSHYKDMAIQPLEFCEANRLPFAESCIIKYVCRHEKKGGREDLEKARHMIDFLLERRYPDPMLSIRHSQKQDPEELYKLI